MTLKEAEIPFALGGSYACWARGGPEPVHDVDFMLREADVPRAVEVLCAGGLRPVDPPEDWLTKVFDGDVLVDLIHHPVGRAVTDQMLARSSEMSVDSVRMPVLDATDWFEMTLLALDERYCDLGRVIPMIRAMREQVDWEQVRRATAESPFAEAALLVATRLKLIPPPAVGGGEPVTVLDVNEPAEYLAGDLHERLAEDPRVAELGLDVAVGPEGITVRGEVATEGRRRAVDAVLADAVPGRPVRNDVVVSKRDSPSTMESVS
ncbi:nucleotidyltransferase family protein [Parafrankia discariae]|uniref:nucleotidyltransferase family protein n=1 Tax=Parafrankia discariae TaxID=365528 RepID=UPI001E2C923F|nr:nucleotidyltransferase family protein [Parafrankia discariae]